MPQASTTRSGRPKVTVARLFWALLAGIEGVLLICCVLWRGLPGDRFFGGLAVTVIFAAGAYWLRGVTADGALAGSLASLATYFIAGPQGFAILVLVFVMTVASSRVGGSRKRELQLADPRTARSAGQVLANLWVAGILLLLDCIFPAWIALPFAAAGFAALAEAAADTVASEIGEAFSRAPHMIIGFAPAAPGTDGAISVIGTAAGLLAAVLVGGAALALRLFPGNIALGIAGIGFLGMLVDSLLGATLQRRRLLTNGGVNLVTTAVSGMVGLVVLR